MTKDDGHSIVDCGLICLVFIAVFFIGFNLSGYIYDKRLIDKGIKQYNPKTGELEWIEPYKEKNND